MTLNNCDKGCKYSIQDISVEDKIMKRLEALGFTGGTIISVLNKKRYGAVIIKVRGTRMALGKSISQGITVAEAPDEGR